MSVPFRLSITLSLLLVLPFPSSAQRVATSFDQLQVLIEAGDKITVRDASGNETTGKLDSLSAHGLTLVLQGKQREWADTEVSWIFQRKQDSLMNGALWGVGGGAGAFGVLAAMFCWEGDCDVDATVAGAIAMYAGLGAAVGVGIDALITRRHPIYEGPSNSAVLSLAPVLANGRRGMALVVRY